MIDHLKPNGTPLPLPLGPPLPSPLSLFASYSLYPSSVDLLESSEPLKSFLSSGASVHCCGMNSLPHLPIWSHSGQGTSDHQRHMAQRRSLQKTIIRGGLGPTT